MNRKLFLTAMTAVLMSAWPAWAGVQNVRYEDFGAAGDGKTDDSEALAKAHDYANARNLPVRAKDEAIYYIGGKNRTISIRTDTDFGTARFIIDDRDLKDAATAVEPVFSVDSPQAKYIATGVSALKKGATDLGMKLPSRSIVCVENDAVRNFIRLGVNRNPGTIQREVLLVNPDGSIDPVTPVVWNYDRISLVTVWPVDENTLTVHGGFFETISNTQKPEEGKKVRYYRRNFAVNRSHVVLDGMEHTVRDDRGRDGMPYNGFLDIGISYDVKILNSRFTGHLRTSQGTYDINVFRSISTLFRNCVQLNDINDDAYWGILGSNGCKNLVLEHCRFSRFDAHMGVCNAAIRHCELGCMGINAIGHGTLLVENTVNHCKWFINLREDYGSFWDGRFIIRNCVFDPLCGKGEGILINGYQDGSHNFGYRCGMPREIVIDGLLVTNGKSDRPAVFFSDFNRDYGKKPQKFPYHYVEKVTVNNLTIQNGRGIILSHHPEHFRNAEFKTSGIRIGGLEEKQAMEQGK